MPWIEDGNKLPETTTFAVIKAYLTEKEEKVLLKPISSGLYYCQGDGFFYSVHASRIIKWWEDEPL